MAVAAPVLERKVNTEEGVYTREMFRDSVMTADERHNACISANYAKLINPESTLKDFAENKTGESEREAAPVMREVGTESLYLVENARADADIFRADSAVNMPAIKVVNAASAQTEEEENEDLRPTQTTIQYKTTAVAKTVEEGKIKTSAKANSKSLFTKRDKIIIAVALSVIVALFVLIIVNSAVISGLNSEVSSLQNALNAAEQTFTQVTEAKNSYLDSSNLFDTVSEFAKSNGMVLK
ncbi:MAG TPA: hypothetical protein DD415_06855 [Clostridiales bacterium]|nr:hypothetical protein [Clostridiales bacterium]